MQEDDANADKKINDLPLSPAEAAICVQLLFHNKLGDSYTVHELLQSVNYTEADRSIYVDETIARHAQDILGKTRKALEVCKRFQLLGDFEIADANAAGIIKEIDSMWMQEDRNSAFNPAIIKIEIPDNDKATVLYLNPQMEMIFGYNQQDGKITNSFIENKKLFETSIDYKVKGNKAIAENVIKISLKASSLANAFYQSNIESCSSLEKKRIQCKKEYESAVIKEFDDKKFARTDMPDEKELERINRLIEEHKQQLVQTRKDYLRQDMNSNAVGTAYLNNFRGLLHNITYSQVRIEYETPLSAEQLQVEKEKISQKYTPEKLELLVTELGRSDKTYQREGSYFKKLFDLPAEEIPAAVKSAIDAEDAGMKRAREILELPENNLRNLVIAEHILDIAFKRKAHLENILLLKTGQHEGNETAPAALFEEMPKPEDERYAKLMQTCENLAVMCQSLATENQRLQQEQADRDRTIYEKLEQIESRLRQPPDRTEQQGPGHRFLRRINPDGQGQGR